MFWTSLLITILIAYFILTKLFIIVEFREQVIQNDWVNLKKPFTWIPFSNSFCG